MAKKRSGRAVRKNPGQRKSARLWLRVGDMGEYEDYGNDLAAVADALIQYQVTTGREISRVKGGIEAPGFRGQNYISLYWGDKNSNHVRDLSSADVAELKREVNSQA